MQLRGVIKCPKCGSVYHRALYDFDYISCTKSGCGQDFIKCTGQPWPRNSEPVELAATDAQEPQPAMCLGCEYWRMPSVGHCMRGEGVEFCFKVGTHAGVR
jgi:hypothetical protein